jgi:hypothetical protein
MDEWHKNKWLETVHPKYKKLLFDFINKDGIYPKSLEYKIIHRGTGEEKWIKTTLYHQNNMYFGFVTDITRYKKT